MNIFYLLEVVDQYDCKQLARLCGEFLAANFEDMWEDDRKRLLSLSVDIWVAMLQSDALLISSEQELFETVLSYANQFDDDKEKKVRMLETLLPHIRYSFIPLKYLIEVVEKDTFLNGLPVMHSLLYETYRYQVLLLISFPFLLFLSLSFPLPLPLSPLLAPPLLSAIASHLSSPFSPLSRCIRNAFLPPHLSSSFPNRLSYRKSPASRPLTDQEEVSIH